MKIKNCIRFALSELYTQKKKMVLILAMLSISLILLLNQLVLIANTYIIVLETKAALAEKESNIYKIDMSSYVVLQSEETSKNIVSFLSDVNDVPGVTVCGSFLYTVEGDSTVLYLSRGLEQLCTLKYADGTDFDWSDKPLAADSKWLADGLYDVPFHISNYTILPMDALTDSAPAFICSSLNNVYFITNDTVSLSDIDSCAKKHHLTLGSIRPMNEILHQMASDIYADGDTDSILLPLLIVFISVFGYIGTILTYLYTEQHNIGILFSIGYSRKDYLKIIITMNLILFLTSYLISFLYENTFGIVNEFYEKEFVLLFTIPVYTLFILLITALGTIVPLYTLWKRQPAELIGGYN
jgi:hypothetical protein